MRPLRTMRISADAPRIFEIGSLIYGDAHLHLETAALLVDAYRCNQMEAMEGRPTTYVS
jgi:hypothetical protein